MGHQRCFYLGRLHARYTYLVSSTSLKDFALWRICSICLRVFEDLPFQAATSVMSATTLSLLHWAACVKPIEGVCFQRKSSGAGLWEALRLPSTIHA